MNITPGTWVAKYDENLQGYEVSGLGGGSKVALIAKHDVSDEELENATLISAAPLLLKALKRLLEDGRSEENKRDARYAIEKALAKEKINKPKPMGVDGL